MTTIKEARLDAGLTQKEMSEKMGIPKRTIENWEMGSRKCPEWAEKLIVKELSTMTKQPYTLMGDTVEGTTFEVESWDTLMEAQAAMRDAAQEDLDNEDPEDDRSSDWSDYVVDSDGEVVCGLCGRYYELHTNKATDFESLWGGVTPDRAPRYRCTTQLVNRDNGETDQYGRYSLQFAGKAQAQKWAEQEAAAWEDRRTWADKEYGAPHDILVTVDDPRAKDPSAVELLKVVR